MTTFIGSWGNTPDLGWQSFVGGAIDRIDSAPGTQESCPAPGSDLYRSGLAEGDRCVQLIISDVETCRACGGSAKVDCVSL